MLFRGFLRRVFAGADQSIEDPIADTAYAVLTTADFGVGVHTLNADALDGDGLRARDALEIVVVAPAGVSRLL